MSNNIKKSHWVVVSMELSSLNMFHKIKFSQKQMCLAFII